MPDKPDPDSTSIVTPFPATSRIALLPTDIIGVKLDVATLLTQPTRPVKWMVDGLLPEKAISIISGMAYIGKSYIGMELAIALSSGRNLFGKFRVEQKYRVGYFDLEMMREDTERRFQRMLKMEPGGTEWGDLSIFAQAALRIDDGDKASWRKFRNIIEKQRLDIVIIDSLRRMHLGDDKDSKQADMIFSALKTIRDETGCASAMIAHWRKTNAEHTMNDPAERLAGSADYRNFVDVHIAAMKHHAKDHLLVFPDKARQADGAPPKYVVKFDHVDRTDKDGPFHLVLSDAPPADNSEEKLMQALVANSPATIAKLAKVSGVHIKTANRIVVRWRKTGECEATKGRPMMISVPMI